MPSYVVCPSEALAAEIIRKNKEAAKKGVKHFKVAAGAPPPPPLRPNDINMNKIKEIGGIDFSANSILNKDLGKFLNKTI